MAWAQYTLDSLIGNWGRKTLITMNENEGEYNPVGIYEKPETEWYRDYGILCVMSNHILMPAELGVYTSQDMYYITTTNLQLGNHVKYKCDEYKIHERADFTYFDQTDLYIYKVKALGRMDKSDEPR